jgi:hypothetical protein
MQTINKNDKLSNKLSTRDEQNKFQKETDKLLKLIRLRKYNNKLIFDNNSLIKELRDKNELIKNAANRKENENNSNSNQIDVCIFEDKNEFIHFVNQQFNKYFNINKTIKKNQNDDTTTTTTTSVKSV